MASHAIRLLLWLNKMKKMNSNFLEVSPDLNFQNLQLSPLNCSALVKATTSEALCKVVQLSFVNLTCHTALRKFQLIILDFFEGD